MNVQMNGTNSLSLNQSPTTNNRNVQTNSDTRANALPLVYTEKELHMAALQGTKVSVGEEQLVRAIDRAIKALEGPSTMFEMQMHEATKTIMVKVINKDTGELIREIPPEKTLDLVAKMMEFAGILIDERI